MMRAAPTKEACKWTLERTFCAAVLLGIAATPGLAQNKGDPGEMRGLKLGLKAQTMTTDGFGEFACGGFPPSIITAFWPCARESSLAAAGEGSTASVAWAQTTSTSTTCTPSTQSLPSKRRYTR